MPRTRQTRRRKGKGKVPDPVRRYVKSQITRSLETKYYNRLNQSISPDYTGVLYDLTQLITQGDTVAQREGDRINLRDIEWRGQLSLADSHNYLRFALIQVHYDSQGHTPVASDFLETVSNGLAPVSIWKWENRSEYTVLWDKTYLLDSTTTPVAQFSGKVGPQKLSKPVLYNPGLSTGIGHVYLLTISDSAAVSHPTFDYDMRIKYKDG